MIILLEDVYPASVYMFRAREFMILLPERGSAPPKLPCEN